MRQTLVMFCAALAVAAYALLDVPTNAAPIEPVEANANYVITIAAEAE